VVLSPLRYESGKAERFLHCVMKSNGKGYGQALGDEGDAFRA
jgi:hypothetical protein